VDINPEKKVLLQLTSFHIGVLHEDTSWTTSFIDISLVVYKLSQHLTNGYSADLMSTLCTPHSYLIVHRYIYSRYSLVFLTLYQLYHSLPSSTLTLSSSLYLSVAT